MAQRRRLKLAIGKVRARTNTGYASEVNYVREVRRSMDDVTSQILDIFDQFKDASEDIMLEALQPTAEKAKYYTPKDTFALVESFYLEKTPFRGKPRVEMGFAKGGKPKYAVYVHEMMIYRHDAPTRAKFLEQALKEDLEQIYTRLGASYRAFMLGR